MNDFLDHLSANDNDIYDLLISGRQKLTDSVLRELARDRGIFCSPEDTREDLADYISVLPHGFHDVSMIVQRREPGNRRERTTSIRLDVALTVEELKEAAIAYGSGPGSREQVVHRPKIDGGFAVNVAYDEFNHTRTRLLQRERHEAEIEFLIEAGKTVVRLPATDKAKRIVAAIKETVEQRRKAAIQEESIELTGLRTPEQRSKFFTSLISSLDKYRLVNVMNLKVSSHRVPNSEDDDSLDLEEEPNSEARMEMFAVVHSMALSGQNLVQSQEYQDLTRRGFYITSITWRSEASGNPPDIVQFEAGFQDRQLGVGFKYAVQGTFRAHKGGHRKTITPVGDVEKARLFSLLESTARKVLADLSQEPRVPGEADE